MTGQDCRVATKAADTMRTSYLAKILKEVTLQWWLKDKVQFVEALIAAFKFTYTLSSPFWTNSLINKNQWQSLAIYDVTGTGPHPAAVAVNNFRC